MQMFILNIVLFPRYKALPGNVMPEGYASIRRHEAEPQTHRSQAEPEERGISIVSTIEPELLRG